MNIVLGAAGQVGSAIVENLIKAQVPVTGVIRNAKHGAELTPKGLLVAIADAFDLPALQSAFKAGTTVFLLTPETGHSNHIIGDTKRILANYRAAIEASPITKIVGLSSLGAQYKTDSGNLEMSYLLEHAFAGMQAQQIFIRPAYFFSNWLPYFSIVKEQGILPTFYPVDLKIPMTSPLDVAEVVAEVMTKAIEGSPIYEIEGPNWYSSQDVALAFGEVFGRKVEAQPIPKEHWAEHLQKIGFTPDAIKNFTKMTEKVIAGEIRAERRENIFLTTKTTLKQYIADRIKSA